MQVYARMMALGYVPTSTTYTALISAYGKAGQLDSALDTFDQMVRAGFYDMSSFVCLLTRLQCLLSPTCPVAFKNRLSL